MTGATALIVVGALSITVLSRPPYDLTARAARDPVTPSRYVARRHGAGDPRARARPSGRRAAEAGRQRRGEAAAGRGAHLDAAPVGAHMIGRSSYRSGVEGPDELVVDELKDVSGD